MISELLDDYDLKARIAPGLILALPILADAVYAAPVLIGWPIFTASGACSLALIYALGQLARARGEAIEAALWDSWGGPPSTRFLRHRDSHFSAELKSLIRSAAAKTFSLTLSTSAEERKEPGRADSAISDAFTQVREYLRKHDPRGLWYRHSVEYGYSRNLYGCRSLWLVVALAAALFSVAYGAKSRGEPFNPASVVGLVSAAAAVYIGWWILPKATRRIADGYAELAWIAFLRTSNEQK